MALLLTLAVVFDAVPLAGAPLWQAVALAMKRDRPATSRD
jgi:hypothetical protein